MIYIITRAYRAAKGGERACNSRTSCIEAYRAAEGGERACNSRTSCIEGEMLAVTKFKSKSDTLIRVMTSIMPYKA